MRKRRYAVEPFDHGEPMFRPNYVFMSAALVTMLVALQMVVTFRAQPHVLSIDLLPLASAMSLAGPEAPVRPSHAIRITPAGMVLWNDAPVYQAELLELLFATQQEPVEPDILFAPDANASYDLALQVLAVIKVSGVTHFCFVNLEEHQVFHKEPQPLFLTMQPPDESWGYSSAGPSGYMPAEGCSPP